jgi:hypothetical protein
MKADAARRHGAAFPAASGERVRARGTIRPPERRRSDDAETQAQGGARGLRYARARGTRADGPPRRWRSSRRPRLRSPASSRSPARRPFGRAFPWRWLARPVLQARRRGAARCLRRPGGCRPRLARSGPRPASAPCSPSPCPAERGGDPRRARAPRGRAQRLEQLARLDPLTGLPNRRALEDRLAYEAIATRAASPCSCSTSTTSRRSTSASPTPVATSFCVTSARAAHGGARAGHGRPSRR